MHRRTAGRPVPRTVLYESDTVRRTNPISLAYRARAHHTTTMVSGDTRFFQSQRKGKRGAET
jgi:hypothetical protein